VKYLLPVLCLLVCVASGLAADSELPATWDTEVNEAEPITNYGDNAFFSIWGGSAITPPEKVLLYFQGVDELRAAGNLCDYAELRLYVTQMVEPGDAGIYKAADAWDEATVTWDNRPGEDRGMEIIQGLPPGAAMGFYVDVTGIVQSWMNDGAPHHGFYVDISGDHPTGAGCQFASSENPDQGATPRMFIEYHQGGDVEEDASSGTSLDVSHVAWGSAVINYTLPSSVSATLSIYDATGSLIQNLSVDSGTNSITWDGDVGVYFVRLQTPDFTLTQKLVLVK
jgi:hypothetical protein